MLFSAWGIHETKTRPISRNEPTTATHCFQVRPHTKTISSKANSRAERMIFSFQSQRPRAALSEGYQRRDDANVYDPVSQIAKRIQRDKNHSPEFHWIFRHASKNINNIKKSFATTKHRTERFTPSIDMHSLVLSLQYPSGNVKLSSPMISASRTFQPIDKTLSQLISDKRRQCTSNQPATKRQLVEGAPKLH